LVPLPCGPRDGSAVARRCRAREPPATAADRPDPRGGAGRTAAPRGCPAADGPPALRGLRLLECCRLRVQDVDFASNQIVARTGKGDKGRVAMLPVVVKAALARHLEGVREQHERDLQYGAGWVELPTALGRKYPTAGREWVWQWVFPATRLYLARDPRQRRRHHLHESVLQ